MNKSTKVFLQVSIIVMLIAGFLGLGQQTQSASASPANALGAWTLEWADEFNGSGAVSSSNWIYDLGHGYDCSTCGNWGTGEIENMTNSTANVNQTGGHLAITPIRDGSGNWTSGRIETQRSDFQPPAGGAMAIEGRLQLPNVSGAAAQGYWPAFWALGAPFRGVYTNWPGVGEIDFMENINGQDNIYATLHCGTNPGGPCNETSGIGSGAHACPGCKTAYHTYRFEFDKSVSPQQMRWYLDGVQFFSLDATQVDATTWNNATNHGFFILLNVAIGGGWPGNPTGSTVSGVPMNVDYVRVYYANGGSAATNTSVVPTAPASTNLALNKPATASSNESGSLTPNLAVDGNTDTRWSSAFSDPQWIRIDLGSTTNISRVILRWEAAYGKSYKIQTSNNGTSWTTIYSTTTGDGGVDDLTGLSGSGRYIRMEGMVRGTPYGYSLYEFEVYGSGGPTAVPTNPSATNTPVPSGDFSQGVTKLNATQAQIVFTSNVNSAWVDVHYTGAPGLGQQNFRMTRNGNTWTQTVSNLSAGTVLTYWFTYEKYGLAYDSAHYTYTH